MVPTSLSILPPQLTVQAHLGANELRHERHHGVRGAAAQREHRAAAALIVIMTKRRCTRGHLTQPLLPTAAAGVKRSA
jgi:hypothetical protein